MKVQRKSILESQGVALARGAFSAVGFLFREQTVQDYGIDAHVEVVESGDATGRLLALQIKSGSSYFEEEEDGNPVYRVDDDHIQYWLKHSLPVIVVLCDPVQDRVLWQVVSNDAIQSTGKGWKLIVPVENSVTEQSRTVLGDLATKIVPVDRYSILEHSDISVGIAKRYRLKVLLNGEFSKPEIAAVVRQVVSEFKTSRYHRSRETEERWGTSDASIINLFVYLSVEDVRDINWICRCLWVDERYPEELPRPQLAGENIGAGIVADWSSRYLTTAKILRRNISSKEVYVSTAEEVVRTLESLVRGFSAEREAEARRDPSGDAQSYLEKMSQEISRLSAKIDSLGRGPLECEVVDLKLHALLCYATNIVAPFLVASDSPKRNRFVEEYSVEDFFETLPHFQYELKKIR